MSGSRKARIHALIKELGIVELPFNTKQRALLKEIHDLQYKDFEEQGGAIFMPYYPLTMMNWNSLSANNV